MPQPISAIGEVAARGHAQPPVVLVGALPFLGDKHVAVRRIMDETSDDLAFARKSDRDREYWQAVQEIGGSVERIDEPGVALVGAFDLGRFPPSRTHSRAAPSLNSSWRIFSALRSAAETKSPGPFTETCRFSTSPKSRFKPRPALRAAAVITFISADLIMLSCPLAAYK